MTDPIPERDITIETIGRRLFGLGRMDGTALDTTTKRANAESLLLIAAAAERIADALEQPPVTVELDATRADDVADVPADWIPTYYLDAELGREVIIGYRHPDYPEAQYITTPVEDGDDDLGTPVEPDPVKRDPFADKKKGAKS